MWRGMEAISLWHCSGVMEAQVALIVAFRSSALLGLVSLIFHAGSHITLQPKTGCPLKLSRVEPGQYLDGRPPEKTRLLLEEVLVRPAGGAHPVVCVGPNPPV